MARKLPDIPFNKADHPINSPEKWNDLTNEQRRRLLVIDLYGEYNKFCKELMGDADAVFALKHSEEFKPLRILFTRVHMTNDIELALQMTEMMYQAYRKLQK